MIGSSYKIHFTVDSYENPVQFLIEDGMIQDIKVVPKLVNSINLYETEIFYSDKGYDSESFG